MKHLFEINKNSDKFGILVYNDVNKFYTFETYNKENILGKEKILKSTTLFPLFKQMLPFGFALKILDRYLGDKFIFDYKETSLLSLLGSRGIGAFEITPYDLPQLDEVVPIDFDLLMRTARHIHYNDNFKIPSKNLKNLLRCGLFTQSNVPCVLVAIDDFTGDVVSGQSTIPDGYAGWKVFLDGVLFTSGSFDTVFDLYTKALNSKLDITEHRYMRDGRQKHLMIKRIDRKGNTKIDIRPLEYFWNIILDNIPNTNIYASSQTSTLKDFFNNTFKILRGLNCSYKDLEKLYKRMVFSYYINNVSKNEENELTYIKTNLLNIQFVNSSSQHWSLAKLEGFNMIVPNDVDWLLEFGINQEIRKAKKIFNDIVVML